MCGEDSIRCEQVVPDNDYVQDVHSRDGVFEEYPPLEPTWVRDESSNGTSLAGGLLSAAEAGSLWIFAPGEQALRVLGVDQDGQLIEHAQLEPQGVEGVLEVDDTLTGPELVYDASGDRGPLLRVRWWSHIACESEEDPEEVCGSSLDELLVFGREPGAAPQRIALIDQDALSVTNWHLVRAHSGDDLFGLEENGLARFAADGARRWLQPAAEPGFARTAAGRTWRPSPAPAIDVLDDERIAYLPFAGLQTPALLAQYWIVDGRGAALEAHYLPDGPLVRSALFHAPRGDKLIAADTSEGDLLLFGIHADESVTLFRVPREQFTDHDLLAASLDAAGTLYAATHAGGRELADQTSLLCRLVDAREGGCFLVPTVPPIVDIQATDANVLFVLSVDGSLRRFDFPE